MRLCFMIGLACLLTMLVPAEALVGGAPTAEAPGVARHLMLIVGGRGNFCTGTAIARDLVLTAAHCVPSGADYKLIEFDSLRQPTFRDVALVVPHPQFDLKSMLAHRVSADVALLKLAAPLSAAYTPAALVGERKPMAVGEKFLLAGYGVSARGDGTAAAPRAPPLWLPPASPARCNYAWSIPSPRASARASAPAPAIPPPRSFRKSRAGCSSWAWSAGPPAQTTAPAAAVSPASRLSFATADGLCRPRLT
jgi:hypothetical protein